MREGLLTSVLFNLAAPKEEMKNKSGSPPPPFVYERERERAEIVKKNKNIINERANFAPLSASKNATAQSPLRMFERAEGKCIAAWEDEGKDPAVIQKLRC